MDTKLKAMIDGGAAIVSPEWLDQMAQTDYGSEIRTCYNRNHYGTKDVYIGWIHPSGQPVDLERRIEPDGRLVAWGSLPKMEAASDEGFALANDPPKVKHRRGEFYGQERTLQKVLIDGLDCLPGQQDLF
jgi:hypothetical protein